MSHDKPYEYKSENRPKKSMPQTTEKQVKDVRPVTSLKPAEGEYTPVLTKQKMMVTPV
jgi:hypothetical protein